MKSFRNRYRKDTIRLKNWDYSAKGMYFITICTHKREHHFGKIIDGKSILSDIGSIAQKYWMEIREHFDNVILDEFIIMPNHIHGIIILEEKKESSEKHPAIHLKTTNTEVERQDIASELHSYSKGGKKEQWKPGTIGVIINQFKRICTIQSRKINAKFKWQPRFYDIIIRNNRAFNNIRNYIIDNPIKWDRDLNNRPGIRM